MVLFFNLTLCLLDSGIILFLHLHKALLIEPFGMSQLVLNSKKLICDVFFGDCVALSNLKELIQKTLEKAIVSNATRVSAL
jgi:hypothetical protein